MMFDGQPVELFKDGDMFGRQWSCGPAEVYEEMCGVGRREESSTDQYER